MGAIYRSMFLSIIIISLATLRRRASRADGGHKALCPPSGDQLTLPELQY